MNATHRRTKESGVVVLALLVLLVLALIATAFFFVKHAYDKKSVATTAAEAVEAGGNALSRNAVNTQRKTDAAIFLSTITAYVSNNSGYLPTEITPDMLEGSGHYTTASIIMGEQPSLKSDKLYLVTGAQCSQSDDGSTVAASSSRAMAVQLAYEQADGSFKGQCLNG